MAMRGVISLGLDPRTLPAAIFSNALLEQVAIIGIFLCYFALSFGFVVICNERFNLDLQRRCCSR